YYSNHGSASPSPHVPVRQPFAQSRSRRARRVAALRDPLRAGAFGAVAATRAGPEVRGMGRYRPGVRGVRRPARRDHDDAGLPPAPRVPGLGAACGGPGAGMPRLVYALAQPRRRACRGDDGGWPGACRRASSEPAPESSRRDGL
ncbi:MAG: hypothetical protein AVDCRST_MAG71-88, partial [uncultured Lysobacter sp.]